MEAYQKLRAWSHRQNPNHVFMLARLEKIRKDTVDISNLPNLVVNYESERICDILDRVQQKVCVLVFNHGLGDFINFLPLYEALKKRYEGIHKFLITASPSRQFHLIYPDAIPLTVGALGFLKDVDYVFVIKYPEPPGYPRPVVSVQSTPYDGVSKPYRCNLDEIGLADFEWSSYRWPISGFLPRRASQKVGVHFSGNTNAEIKNPSIEVAKKIWDEIGLAGFDPLEVHIDHFFSLYEKTEWDFIPSDKTFRSVGSSLAEMFHYIQDCRYFVGVDSGPLYLAISLLGVNNCLGLQRNLPFYRYFPDPSFKFVDISNYKNYSVTSILTLKDIMGS